MNVLLAPLLALVCILKQLVYLILAGILLAINAIVGGLALIVTALIALLPDMPEVRTLDAVPEYGMIVGWSNWFFPVATCVTIVFVSATLWLGFQAVAVILRWAKVIS